MKLGIIREGKTPPDHRVPLTPSQCRRLLDKYPNLSIQVESSPIRAFTDDEYRAAGVEVTNDISGNEVLIGVKEVPIDQLIPNKTYLFFSHTFKKQEYNRPLLQAILKKNIRLIDYEVLKDASGKRLLGFGRYAGVVGAYNAFRAWGEMTGTFSLKPAHLCHDRKEMEAELVKVDLPADFKLVMTGSGRVAGGATEIFSALRLAEVKPEEFLRESYDEPVFTELFVTDYFVRKDGQNLGRKDFYQNPGEYRSRFMEFASVADVYVPCHYWGAGSPYIFTRQDTKSPDFKVKLVADISCDINGPVASTVRPSTITHPFYGYDPQQEQEVAFGTPGSIGVVAVDNLPCELPRDASEDFGNEFIKNVMPHFFNDDADGVLERATQTRNGNLTPAFAYLQSFVDQN